MQQVDQRRWALRAALALFVVLMLPVTLLVGANVFLNFGVPALVNERPEKLRLRFDWAWTWWPGQVVVHGLEIRGQGRADQWQLAVDRAAGTIDLQGLRERRFLARDVRASGASFRYRWRADAPVPPADDATPPIAGLTNPPDPAPGDARSPLGPWEIVLPGAVVEDVRELWIEDYRFGGHASATGDVALGDHVEVDARLVISDGRVARGPVPLADGLSGELAVAVSGLERGAPMTRESLVAVSTRARIAAEAEDLDFLDFYLREVPWLSVDGAAALVADVSLDSGRFQTGSWLTAETSELVVGFVAFEVRGDGRVRLEVVEDDAGVPRSEMSVRFGAFSIREHAEEPLVVGDGFRLTAVSPDTDLVQPFTTLDVVLDLPKSELPDVARFGRYLPAGVGLAILGGAGHVHGRLVASAEDARLSGDMYLDADSVRATLDGLAVTTDLELHAKLADGRIGQGLYDFGGSELSISRLGLVDPEPDGRREQDESRSWWANVRVLEGKAHVGAATYLDAALALRCATSVPFVRLVAQRKSLPGWVQGLLDIPDVAGTGRVLLGTESITVDPFALTGGNFEVEMRWFRERKASRGAVFARLGKLSVGLDFAGAEHAVHLFDARRWYDGLSADAGAAPAGSARAEDGDSRRRTAKEEREPRTDRPRRTPRRRER